MITALQPPDCFHLEAAQGWLELGNPAEADDELDKITPELRAHPDVLKVRWEICAAAKKWDAALEIAAALVRLAPDDPFGLGSTGPSAFTNWSAPPRPATICCAWWISFPKTPSCATTWPVTSAGWAGWSRPSTGWRRRSRSATREDQADGAGRPRPGAVTSAADKRRTTSFT